MSSLASRLALALVVAGLAACSSSLQVAQIPIDGPKPQASSTPAADLSRATLTALKKPEKLLVDGDLAEWGSLVGGDPRPGAGAPPPASRVAISLHPHGAALAAEVAAEPTEGLWIGISFDDPLLPPIGYWVRSGGIQELNCEQDMDGQPLEPDVAASCKELLSDHEAFGEAHRARFRRFYRLDDKGIRALDPGGALVPIDGSQAVIKATPTGFAAEATLPAKALPRTQQAPLEGFQAIARIKAGGKPPAVDVGEWDSLGPPDPVGFEPHAALREAVFLVGRSRSRISPFALSYQPGDGLEMERVGYASGNTTSVESHAEVLYSKQIASGDIEVGYANVDGRGLAVLKAGEPIAVIEISGEPRGVVKRGDQIHVFSFDRHSPSDAYGTDFATWHGYGVQPDGSVSGEVLLKTDVPYYWAPRELVESHSPDFSVLMLSGHPPGTFDEDAPADAPTIDVTWTWSAEATAYLPEITDSRDPPKKPAAKPGPGAPPKAPKPTSKPAPAAPKPAAGPKK